MRKLGLAFAILIAIVFTVSCVNKEVPVTETYYETEYKTEYYTDIVKGEDELTLENYWYCENLRMGGGVLPDPFHIRDESPFPTIVGGYAGVWCLEYELPEYSNSTSKVVIQTWEAERPDTIQLGTDTLTIEEYEGFYGPYEPQKSEMVSAYDVTEIGHISKPPFDKPLYIIRTYVGEGGYTLPPQLNVFPFEEKQFNEWLDQFNTKLKSCHLGTQFDCPENRYNYMNECLETPTETYEFDTTGVKNLAIIIAGRGYRGKDQGFASVLREPLLGGPWPIKSIRLIWVDEIPKQHQVPYQVEKQRTVMQTQNVPFWEVIFR